jgi:hypothetical protein
MRVGTKADQLYLQLAISTDAMRAAASSYLRRVEQSKDLLQREILLQCTAFFAQFADRAGDQMQGSLDPTGRMAPGERDWSVVRSE